MLFLPIQIIGIKLLSFYPEKVENYYSQSFFYHLSKVEHFLFDSIPFSVGDLLYIIAGIALIRWIYHRIRTKFIHPKKWATDFFVTLSLLYFSFNILWGLNYYRIPLHEKLHFQTEYEYDDLKHLTQELILKTNELQLQLMADHSLPVQINFSSKKLNEISIQSFDNLKDKRFDINHNFKQYKSSVFSLPLTYMGFSGYLNPWTNEAQVNAKIPAYRMPVLVTHEMAHQLGYAKENEANFLAAMACINHENLYIKYAGYSFALQYCLADIARQNKSDFEQLKAEINPGILKNYQEISTFWKAYQNPIEPFFEAFYDRFLKVNNQPQGMKSYHEMVGLLVNYHQKHATLE